MRIAVKKLGIVAFVAMLVFVLAGCKEPEQSSSKYNIVNISPIQGVTIPVTGETPVRTITENAQYSGTVTWNGSPAIFAADTLYIATIMLTVKTNYTMQGVAANFFSVAGAMMVSNNANSGVITAVFPATGGTASNPDVINIAVIDGVTIPVTSATPVTRISENSQYSGTVTWSGSPSNFAAETQYIATIMLTAKTGFTLQGVGANFFMVAGATSVSNNANSGVITAVFPHTGGTASNPDIVNTAAINGVTIPVTGATPVTRISENSQYSGIVTWNGSPSTFAADTQYTATITLTAKTGYTLQGLGVNFFTVAGATSVSNNANSGVITVVFPKTTIANINPDIIELTANTWTNGNIAISSGEQWFKFTATAATQYIHFNPDSLIYVYVQLYDNNNSAVGNTTILYSSVPYTTRSLTISKEYYIKVTPYTGNGSYMIGFNTSITKPIKQVIDLTIKTQPTKLVYTHGNALDLAGLIVTLTYYDYTTEDVTAINFTAKNIIANPAQGASLVHVTHNGQPVTITCGELSLKTANNLTVTKATSAWANPTVNTTYTPTLTLGGVIIPDGYVFTAPTTKLYAGNYQYFAATYTNPDGNYETVSGNITVNVAKSGPAVWPTAATITYGSPLSSSVLSGGDTTAGSFAWTSGTTFPTVTNSGYSVTFTPIDTANYTVTTGTVAITVNKAFISDVVAAPALNRYAHNGILLSVTTVGYDIEYGISTSNNAATAVWQSGLLFTGLNKSTSYYFFARIAESANYHVGPASGSLQVTTRSSNVLTVTTSAEWGDACTNIAVFGNGTAETPQTYTITISGDVAVGGGGNFSSVSSFGSVSNVVITLQGNGKLYLNSQGYMIRIDANQTLIIDSTALTLQGLDNNASLIDCSGTLELKNGEIINNHKSYTLSRSGERYYNGGGGVYVRGGTFIMTGGIISGNSIFGSDNNDKSPHSVIYNCGGGVYVSGGTFTITGGTITGNNAKGWKREGIYSGYLNEGGGVYISNDSTFFMNGGTISDNSTKDYNGGYNAGGGIYASDTFTMNGGTISGNNSDNGGGIYANDTFTMNGGTISGNNSDNGGGVYANSVFTMTGGIISGNSCKGDYISNGGSYYYISGGGVFVSNAFTKTGGIIYGNDALEVNKNTVTGTNAKGYAVFYSFNPAYYRDSTLGENDNLYSNSPLPANSGQTLNGWTKR